MHQPLLSSEKLSDPQHKNAAPRLDLPLRRAFARSTGQLVEVNERGRVVARYCNAFLIDKRMLLGVGESLEKFCKDSYKLAELRVSFDSSLLPESRSKERLYKIGSVIEHGVYEVSSQDKHFKINYGIFLLATCVAYKLYGSAELSDALPAKTTPITLANCFARMLASEDRIGSEKRNKEDRQYNLVSYNLPSCPVEINSGAPVALKGSGKVFAVHLFSNRDAKEGRDGQGILIRDIAKESKKVKEVLSYGAFFSENYKKLAKDCRNVEKAILGDNSKSLERILNSYHPTPLMLVKYYLKNRGKTLLFYALSLEKLSCASVLKKYDSINEPTNDDVTPIQYVCLYGSEKACEFLHDNWNLDISENEHKKLLEARKSLQVLSSDKTTCLIA